MQDRPQWVAWRFAKRDPKWTKQPINPTTGNLASSTDPSTWATFQQALAYHREHPATTDGVGYVFSVDDPYCGIDLDDCRDPDSGLLEQWGVDAIELLGSYTEVSPTGTGAKIILRGRCPGDKHRRRWRSGEVEVYDRARFFALTGHRIDCTPPSVLEHQHSLNQLYRQVFGMDEAAQQANGARRREQPAPSEGLNDNEVIERAGRATNGEKFRRLWAGDTSGHDDDSSAADLALCSLLRFWTGGDRIQMDRLFRQSGLMRAKWDETHSSDGRTYGDMTLDKAMPGETRDPNHCIEERAILPMTAQQHESAIESAQRTTDAGNARRFVEQHGADLRHCHPWRKWLTWDGKRWRQDDTGESTRRAKRVAADLYDWTISQMAEIRKVMEGRSA